MTHILEHPQPLVDYAFRLPKLISNKAFENYHTQLNIILESFQSLQMKKKTGDFYLRIILKYLI